ncbi:amidohydrolase [Nocardioidaceae bacterium]|nr:amidohydrolase [Nocardioidaceae bacterium]
MTDRDVPSWLKRHEIPGIVDVHVHFLPPRIQAAVWAQFDQAGPKIGRPWPITYRGSVEERVQQLQALGVRRFGTLPYAHKPGIAEFLNDWAWQFADATPAAMRSATFYPEPEATTYVAERLADGADVFKVHVQVGEFDVRHPDLDPVWAQLAEAGTPVVLHAGSGPVGNEFTGPTPVRSVLERHPGLALVMAHSGAPEFEAFLAMAEGFEHVLVDTTMVFTDFFDTLGGAFPDELLPRYEALGRAGKVLLGSDFPTIPYPYAHQLESLERLGFGSDWLRAVCWDNPRRLFEVPEVPEVSEAPEDA